MENRKKEVYLNASKPSSQQITKTKLVAKSTRKSPRLLLFSREQKIVSAVWYHERKYSGLSHQDILNNFSIRFNTTPPYIDTIAKWERKLFTRGFTNKKDPSTTTLSRLIHAPYVRESLKKQPNISMRSRAQMLGLSQGTLKCIVEQDLKDYPPDFDEDQIIAADSDKTKKEN